MKTKNLVIIFILFFLITLASGLEFFLTGEKEKPVLNKAVEIINSDNQLVVEEKPDEAVKSQPALKTAEQAKPAVLSEKITPPAVADKPTEERIQAVMLINGVEYRVNIKPGSSVYDLMNALKGQKKIDFKGSNYSGMGYFIEEINGVKNNQGGMNWLYYVNGQPAKIGVSFYKLKNNDTIEWKYENKSF